MIANLLFVAAPSIVSGASSADAFSAESALASAEASWQSQGAVGVFRDPGGGLVVDVPVAVGGRFRLGPVSAVGLPVSTRIVSLDAAQLDEALNRLDNLVVGPSMQGESAAFFFDPREAKVYISTTAPESVIKDALGDLAYLISYHSSAVMDSTRCDDTAPFWGGASINQCSPAYCTTGFTVVNNATGARLLTTAGHCFINNTVVHTPGNTTIGTISNRHCSGGSVDVEQISGKTYGHWIYIGGAGGTGWPVDSAGDPTVGFTYQYSGGTTYENSVIVTSTSATVTSPMCGTLTNMIAFQTAAGVCPSAGGDSGAPFYIKGTSTVRARGALTQKETTGQHCFGPKWSSMANALNVSIATQ